MIFIFILFQEAIDWLLSHSFVLPGGVGIVGVSTGGTLSLLMATYFPDKVCIEKVIDKMGHFLIRSRY